MWMNEHEIQTLRWEIDAEQYPNLAEAAYVLDNLKDWTNANSDGWPYWKKPAAAAKALMEMLHEHGYAIRFGHHRDGSPLVDVPRERVVQAIKPIKAFLTRQGATDALVIP